MLRVVPAPVVAPAVVPRAHVQSQQFFVRMAYACAGLAIAGFVPTYWAPLATGSFVGPSILHLHGVLFSAWTILFVVQTRSAASGRFDRHRALGLAGIALATAMLFLGVMVGTMSLEGSIASGFEPRRARRRSCRSRSSCSSPRPSPWPSRAPGARPCTCA